MASEQQTPPGPQLAYLKTHFVEALESFYKTLEKIVEDNPVDLPKLIALKGKAATGELSTEETQELGNLVALATNQGKAVGATMGFFLKYKPYPMLAEIRAKGGICQPAVGPVIIASHDLVLDTLSRHDEFTVAPYGEEMKKSMSDKYNGGYTTFILSTDKASLYEDDKMLLTTIVNKKDPELIRQKVRAETQRRMKIAVAEAKANGEPLVDVVPTVARFIPVYLGDQYLGVPVAPERGTFELNDLMLKCYGDKVAGPDGVTPLPLSITGPNGETIDLPDSALGKNDGVIPDEETVYHWIVSCFHNFFNNVSKDVAVQAKGVRAYRELLCHLLNEVENQRDALKAGKDVPDNMLTRLLKIQMGLTPMDIEASRVCDLRIAENVMGTIVGAVAGQEEATSRVIDSMIRLKDGEYRTSGAKLKDGQRYGCFSEAREMALNILAGKDVEQSQKLLSQYVVEALRLQPQGEVLLRVCANDGATVGNSRPISAGTLVFASHGSAMQDVDDADAFILGREDDAYLQFGYRRHTCLGRYVSPVLMEEALIAVLALENVHRPAAVEGQTAFPLEHRLGQLQLDDNNLYAKSFTLAFEQGGSTAKTFS